MYRGGIDCCLVSSLHFLQMILIYILPSGQRSSSLGAARAGTEPSRWELKLLCHQHRHTHTHPDPVYPRASLKSLRGKGGGRRGEINSANPPFHLLRFSSTQ